MINEQFKDRDLRQNRNERDHSKELANLEISLNELINIKKIVANELNYSFITDKYFQFYKIVIPKIEICCSQCFPYETSQELTFAQIKGIEPLTCVLFNIIPYKTQTIVLFAYPKHKAQLCGKYFADMLIMPEKELKKRLSDLLLIFGDDWLCSPNLYLKYLRHQEKQLQRLYIKVKPL